MNLPPWLQENPDKVWETEYLPSSYSLKQGFIQKTLKEFIHLAQEGVFAEGLALKKGVLQSIDPRAKVFSLLALLFAVNLVHHLSLIWSCYLILILFSSLSRIPPQLLLKRVGTLVLFFGVLPVLPALFNWVRPGDPLFMIHTFKQPFFIGPLEFPQTLFVTQQGLRGNLLFLSRLLVSVTLVTVLTLTTRWNELLHSLRSFFIPKIFVKTLEMTYRYIFVLIQALEELLFARKARDAGRSAKKEQRRFMASSLGSLFGKSMLMSEEVYFSMLSRGYHGESQTLKISHFKWSDALAVCLVTVSSLILLVADQVLGGSL